MFEFSRSRFDDRALDVYAELFRQCFPGATHLDRDYLRWLYRDNPAGTVVGFDAYSEGRLAAHYVCVPTEAFVMGDRHRGLLSLNTATHPDFQGRGLFTELAKRTYEAGAAEGFSFVHGVANANSTPGFTRKLGFQLVRPLEAKISLGPVASVDWAAVCRSAAFRRDWTNAHLTWRAANPRNRIRIESRSGGVLAVHAKTDHRGIIVANELPCVEPTDWQHSDPVPWLPRLFLGLIPDKAFRWGFAIDVPKRLRPSPLNLIYLSLDQRQATLPPERVSLGFIDFDAY